MTIFVCVFRKLTQKTSQNVDGNFAQNWYFIEMLHTTRGNSGLVSVGAMGALAPTDLREKVF